MEFRETPDHRYPSPESFFDWTPATVPTGTAIFGASNGTTITFSTRLKAVNSTERKFTHARIAKQLTLADVESSTDTGIGLEASCGSEVTFRPSG
jgi:hypothetical protein